MGSSALILSLASKNCGAANDDHLELIELIYTGTPSLKSDACWQCYHPKLYHSLVAYGWKYLNILNKRKQIQLAQLINACCGILTIAFCLLFISQLNIPGSVQILSFALIAFNPKLIGIFSQPTNDAMVICFGTLLLFYFQKLMTRPDYLSFVKLILIAALAIHVKYNALIIILGILIAAAIKMIYLRNIQRKQSIYMLTAFIIFLLSLFISANYFGEYKNRFQSTDLKEIYNSPVFPTPKLFEKQELGRPGIRSIAEGYFSFKITSLIKHPQIKNDRFVFIDHRTSLWSQLYGRTHFLYFDYWPYCWQNDGSNMLAAGRVSLALGLIPSFIFIISLLFNGLIRIKNITQLNFSFIKNDPYWYFDIFIFGFISFIILFSLKGQDFSYMKIIYLFPGILATIPALVQGLYYVERKLSKIKQIKFLYYASMLCLIIYYLIPVLNLINRMPYCPS